MIDYERTLAALKAHRVQLNNLIVDFETNLCMKPEDISINSLLIARERLATAIAEEVCEKEAFQSLLL